MIIAQARDQYIDILPPDIRDRQRALHDGIVAELRAKSKQDTRPRPPVSIREWLDRFLASGYDVRINDAAQLALCVPESMSDAVYAPLAAYAVEHEDELRSLIAPAPVNQDDSPPVASEQPPPVEVRNGVLTDTHLYYKRDGKLVKHVVTHAPVHAGDILQFCLDYHLSAIWVMSQTQASARATQAFIDAGRSQWTIETAQVVTVKRDQQRATFIGGWKKASERKASDTGDQVFICFAEYATDWKLDRITDPVTLLATVSYIEDALAQAVKTPVPIRFSPGNVGKEVMFIVNGRKRNQWIAHIDVNQYAPVVTEKVNQRLWKRALTSEEQAQAWIVAYDKNSSYPASCTSVMLGTGNPTLVDHPTFDARSERPLPGIWHCTISGSSEYDGVTLPHPTDGKTSGWFWSYTVKLLHELGYQVTIDQAYVWQEGHTILRPFAEKLWQARASLQTNHIRYPHAQARGHAQDAVKRIMNVSLGWLDIGKNRVLDDKDTPWYHRPDWYQLLKDNAHYRMFWSIRTQRKNGYVPVGLYEDCLYYATSERDHTLAVPGMMKKVGLGGFKQKYDADVSMALAAPLFNNPAIDMYQINSTFNDLKSEEE